MSSEVRTDRLDSSFSARNEAFLAVIKVVGDHDRREELCLLIQRYGTHCAQVEVETHVAREPTEPTEPAKDAHEAILLRIDNWNVAWARLTVRLSSLEEKSYKLADERNQRLKVVESTLADSEDARERQEAELTELRISIRGLVQKFDRLWEKYAAADKEAEDETDGMSPIKPIGDVIPSTPAARGSHE